MHAKQRREKRKSHNPQPYLNNQHFILRILPNVLVDQPMQTHKSILKGTPGKMVVKMSTFYSSWSRCLLSKTAMLRLLQRIPVTLVIVFQTKDFTSQHQPRPSELKHQSSSKPSSYISHEFYLHDRVGTKPMLRCRSRILIRSWWDPSPAAAQFPWGQNPPPSWFDSPK